MTPAQLRVAEARKYLGVKWRHRGRKSWALDCIGLVVFAVRAGGMEMRDRVNYGREPWKDGLQKEMRDHFGEPVTDWQPGDVVLMRFDNQPGPGHVGLLADYCHGGLSLIHSYSLEQVAEHGLDGVWRARIIEVYRP